MGGGGGTEVKTLQSTDKKSIPDELKPAILGDGTSQGFLPRAIALSEQGLQPPLPPAADRLAPFSQDTLTALEANRALAVGGDPSTNAARAFTTNLIQTPSLENENVQAQLAQVRGDLVDTFNEDISPSLRALSRSSGSFGNSGVVNADDRARFGLARAIGDAETGIISAAENRRLQAGQFAPTLAAEGRQDIASLFQAGQIQQTQEQTLRDLGFQNLLEARQAPLRDLDILGSAIATAGGGFINSTGTQQQFAPAAPNQALQGIGAASSILGGIGAVAPLFGLA